MSVATLVVCWALTAQIAGDRYGAPPGESAAADGQQSGRTAPRNEVGPPPPLTPSTRTAPAATPEDYGHGIPSSPPRTPAVTAPTSNSPGVTPSVMMRSMLTPPAGSRLTGQGATLADVLAGASTRQEQSQRVEAYWDLCSSVADYYLGVREQDELQRLRSTVANVSPVWQEAESELGVRIATSERAAVASQYRLASLIGREVASTLPLPADMPHCGDYYARYDQVFAGRGHPSRVAPEAHELSQLLPMRYEELTDAASAVARAEEFMNAIASQRASAGDGTGTLRALELLALRRRAFVQIARDYNRRIARYTELASPGAMDADRLIGMLIKREAASNTATRPTTPAPPPNRQSQVPADDPTQTFAEGWEPIRSAAQAPRDEAVEPASAETPRSKPRREHSLLVPSQ